MLQIETSSRCKSIPTNMILYVIRYSSCDGREGLSRFARKLGSRPPNWSIPPGNHTVFWWSPKPTLVYFAVNLCFEALKNRPLVLVALTNREADLLHWSLFSFHMSGLGYGTRKALG